MVTITSLENEQNDDFLTAVASGNIRESKSLIERNANIDAAMWETGSRALHIATHKFGTISLINRN